MKECLPPWTCSKVWSSKKPPRVPRFSHLLKNHSLSPTHSTLPSFLTSHRYKLYPFSFLQNPSCKPRSEIPPSHGLGFIRTNLPTIIRISQASTRPTLDSLLYTKHGQLPAQPEGIFQQCQHLWPTIMYAGPFSAQELKLHRDSPKHRCLQTVSKLRYGTFLNTQSCMYMSSCCKSLCKCIIIDFFAFSQTEWLSLTDMITIAVFEPGVEHRLYRCYKSKLHSDSYIKGPPRHWLPLSKALGWKASHVDLM